MKLDVVYDCAAMTMAEYVRFDECSPQDIVCDLTVQCCVLQLDRYLYCCLLALA